MGKIPYALFSHRWSHIQCVVKGRQCPPCARNFFWASIKIFSYVKTFSYISTHTACPYKNYLPKCSQSLQTHYLLHKNRLFFLLSGDHTPSRKKIGRKPQRSCADDNEIRLPILQFWLNWVKVIKSMCTRVAPPACAETLQIHGFLCKHIGKFQRGVTLIVSCESKICPVKSLVSTHSACPCKNCPPKCSQPPMN